MKVALKLPVPLDSKAEAQLDYITEVLDRLAEKYGPIEEVRLDWSRS